MFNPESPPELDAVRWLNSDRAITLAGLKGRVVVLLAFQMLCPGCVDKALPQMKKLAERFSADEVAVVALHTVFEHHAVMTPAALEVFVSEYKWPFPVGIDRPDGEGPSKTMGLYEMRGTPTILVFDRQGRLRRHYFGHPDDMMIAAEVMAMSIEAADAPREQSIAIERAVHAALRDPNKARGHHHHDHAACGHDHHHDHAHGHHHHEHGEGCGHGHGEGCGGDGCCRHEHAHEPAAAEPTRPTPPARGRGRAKPKAGAR